MSGLPYKLAQYIENRLQDFVTEGEFAPVKMVAYGVVTIMATIATGLLIWFFTKR